MAPTADLKILFPPARMPKLKYRNPLPDSPLSPTFQAGAAGLPCYPHDQPLTPISIPASTSSRSSFETASFTSVSLASIASSVASSDDSMSSKKTKRSSIFGFLSLKEPSQIALEQYAQQQRKHTATKSPSSPSFRHSGTFVGMQLPSSVPKVNSKWDGVPEAARKRHSVPGSSTKDNRNSLLSQHPLGVQLKHDSRNNSSRSTMTDGTCDSPNFIASAATSVSDFNTGDQDLSFSDSPSAVTLPERSCYFSYVSPSDAFHQAIAGPPPRLPQSASQPSPSRDDSESFRTDSPASSPDSTDMVVKETADAIFKKLKDRPNQLPVNPPQDEQVPQSHDFLFDPPSIGATSNPVSPMASPTSPYYAPTSPTQNFNRPIAPNDSASPVHRPAPYRSTPSSPALPTLYESSLASTESLATVQDDSDIRSIAPSELSVKWSESPQQRLGLGGRLRMNDVLPWHSQGDPPGKPKKNRLSMFGLGALRVQGVKGSWTLS